MVNPEEHLYTEFGDKIWKTLKVYVEDRAEFEHALSYFARNRIARVSHVVPFDEYTNFIVSLSEEELIFLKLKVRFEVE